MASSLIFLCISAILFIIVFGIMFNLSTVILGAFFAVVDSLMAGFDLSPEWEATYREISETSSWLILLIMSLGIVIFIIKLLMIAAARGRD